MLWLSWRYWQRGHLSIISVLLQTILPSLLVGGSVFTLMESGGHGLSALLGDDRPGGGDAIWFVPLFETTTQWQHYTMFSPTHILDWANAHLLISPFGLPLLVMSLMAIHRFSLSIFDTPAEKDFAHFLGLTSLMYILFTWLWNPDYGGRKDWDLFAPSAFVYTLLAGYLLVRSVSNKQKVSQAGLFAVAVSLLHTAAWVFVNIQELPEF
jgi:hypothetical protein